MKEPKLNAITRKFLRLWGPQEVPSAQVTGGQITPGTYRAIPALGWIERRGPLAVLGLHFIALRNQEVKPIGAITMGLPVTKRTELFVNGFLRRLNWDGRVWPFDDDKGWPMGTGDEAQIRELLKNSGRIASTLCFPSDPIRGAATIEIPVLKRSSTFNWAPFEELEDETPTVAYLDRFRELCKDPSPFVPLN